MTYQGQQQRKGKPGNEKNKSTQLVCHHLNNGNMKFIII